MPEQPEPTEPTEPAKAPAARPPTPEEQSANLSVQEDAAKEREENRGYQ